MVQETKVIIMAITDGYSRPVPVGGRPIPFSPVETKPTIEYAKPAYNSVGEVLDAFKSGLISAEAAVSLLVTRFGYNERDATNTVFSASSTGQDLDEWVEEAQSGMKEGLQGTFGTTPKPGKPGKPSAEIETIPLDDSPEQGGEPSKPLTDDQRYALIGILVAAFMFKVVSSRMK